MLCSVVLCAFPDYVSVAYWACVSQGVIFLTYLDKTSFLIYPFISIVYYDDCDSRTCEIISKVY